MVRLWGHKKDEEEPPPERRDVPVRALTPSGWISGTLVVPGIVGVVDFIHKESFLRLTEVQFEGDEEKMQFLALKRDSIVFLSVDSNENLESVETVGFQEEHRVTCWIEGGAVQGVMLLRLGARLSDYIARHDGLIVLRECRYRVRNRMTMKVEKGESWALLMNPQNIVAVTEGPQTGGG